MKERSNEFSARHTILADSISSGRKLILVWLKFATSGTNLFWMNENKNKMKKTKWKKQNEKNKMKKTKWKKQNEKKQNEKNKMKKTKWKKQNEKVFKILENHEKKQWKKYKLKNWNLTLHSSVFQFKFIPVHE